VRGKEIPNLNTRNRHKTSPEDRFEINKMKPRAQMKQRVEKTLEARERRGGHLKTEARNKASHGKEKKKRGLNPQERRAINGNKRVPKKRNHTHREGKR